MEQRDAVAARTKTPQPPDLAMTDQAGAVLCSTREAVHAGDGAIGSAFGGAA